MDSVKFQYLLYYHVVDLPKQHQYYPSGPQSCCAVAAKSGPGPLNTGSRTPCDQYNSHRKAGVGVGRSLNKVGYDGPRGG